MVKIQINLDFTVDIIGSDIDPRQFENAHYNMKELVAKHNLSHLKSDKTRKFKFDPSIPSHNFCESINLANCHFEKIEDLGVDLTGYDIVTNPPYGLNLEGKKPRVSMEKSFTNFDKFLYKNRSILGDIYIVYPNYVQRTKYHYISESDFHWEEAKPFYSGGYQLAVFKCSKKLKAEVTMLASPTPKTDDIALYEEKNEEDRSDVLMNMQWNSRTQKAKILAERQKRRNEYLKKQKELEDEKLKKAEESKILARQKKMNKMEGKLNQMGLTGPEVDLLNRNLDQEISKKQRKLDNKIKKANAPKWS